MLSCTRAAHCTLGLVTPQPLLPEQNAPPHLLSPSSHPPSFPLSYQPQPHSLTLPPSHSRATPHASPCSSPPPPALKRHHRQLHSTSLQPDAAFASGNPNWCIVAPHDISYMAGRIGHQPIFKITWLMMGCDPALCLYNLEFPRPLRSICYIC